MIEASGVTVACHHCARSSRGQNSSSAKTGMAASKAALETGMATTLRDCGPGMQPAIDVPITRTRAGWQHFGNGSPVMRDPKIGLLAVAVAGGLLVSGASRAQDGDAMFRQLDANADGRISAQEHGAAVDAMFKRMDADHDGTISAAERMAMPRRHDGMSMTACPATACLTTACTTPR